MLKKTALSSNAVTQYALINGYKITNANYWVKIRIQQ